ncbi:MAG: GTP cyclohydrolase I FolE [Balneolaceae bacterium]
MNKDRTILDEVTNSRSDAEEIGDNHIATSVSTPLRDDAFEQSDEEKIERIQHHFYEIMHTLGLDMEDDSLNGTPYRVAKMYVQEIFSGLSPETKPIAKKFGNTYQYGDMVVVKNVNVASFCEHHFLPFLGKAHIGYFSKGDVIGLSKVNRIVEYFCKRPQVQERLTLQILEELKHALETDDVAVFIESKHFCVSIRGIQDRESSTVTASYSGVFEEETTQQRFIDYIRSQTEMG